MILFLLILLEMYVEPIPETLKKLITDLETGGLNYPFQQGIALQVENWPNNY